MSIQQALYALERETALLVWQLRARRLTSKQHAIYANSLVGTEPKTGLTSRIISLTEEIEKWLTAENSL